VSYKFPATIKISGLDIQAAFGFEQATFYLGFPDWFNKRIVFSEVIVHKPWFTLERTQDGQLGWGYIALSKYRGGPSGPGLGFVEGVAETREQDSPPTDAGDASLQDQDISKTMRRLLESGVYIQRLTVGDGEIAYTDYALGPSAMNIKLQYVYLKLDPFLYPFGSQQLSLNAAGTVGETNTMFSDRWFEFSGWFTPGKKDMDMDLRLIDPDGTTGLEADLISRNNKMKVSGRMQIKSKNFDEDSALKISEFPGDFWSTVNLGDIDMDISFSFNTRMDNFKIGQVSIEGNLGFEGLPEKSAAPKK